MINSEGRMCSLQELQNLNDLWQVFDANYPVEWE